MDLNRYSDNQPISQLAGMEVDPRFIKPVTLNDVSRYGWDALPESFNPVEQTRTAYDASQPLNLAQFQQDAAAPEWLARLTASPTVESRVVNADTYNKLLSQTPSGYKWGQYNGGDKWFLSRVADPSNAKWQDIDPNHRLLPQGQYYQRGGDEGLGYQAFDDPITQIARYDDLGIARLGRTASGKTIFLSGDDPKTYSEAARKGMVVGPSNAAQFTQSSLGGQVGVPSGMLRANDINPLDQGLSVRKPARFSPVFSILPALAAMAVPALAPGLGILGAMSSSNPVSAALSALGAGGLSPGSLAVGSMGGTGSGLLDAALTGGINSGIGALGSENKDPVLASLFGAATGGLNNAMKPASTQQSLLQRLGMA